MHGPPCAGRWSGCRPRPRRIRRRAAFGHHQHPVGQFQDLVQILAHQQHRRAGVARRHDPGADLGHRGEIEPETGVGDDQQIDLAVQFAGQHRALHIAARQRRDRAVERGGLDLVVAHQPARPGCASRAAPARSGCHWPVGVEAAEADVLDHASSWARRRCAAALRAGSGPCGRGFRRGWRHRARRGPRCSPALVGRWPVRISISSIWPLPEMPAMPTTSPPRTFRSSMAICFRPERSRARMPFSSSTVSPEVDGARGRCRRLGLAHHHRRHVGVRQVGHLAASRPAGRGAAPRPRRRRRSLRGICG